MDAYLKGFVDGYNKAKETSEIEVEMDRTKVAQLTYKSITELQEKEKRTRNTFSAG